MSIDSDFANELLQRVKAAAGKPVVETSAQTSAQHRAGLTDAEMESIKGSGLNKAAIKFIELMCKTMAGSFAREIVQLAEISIAQSERIKDLEERVALLQSALAQEGKSFTLPDNGPLSFTTRRA
ncbi:hypothetical protein [Cupriavidus sp. DL-D2]|uniref:hypothetical protein n=1 Tax=Cupriavidus sp. DL-D2 TaxID=3144974 RepID=UPI00321240EF